MGVELVGDILYMILDILGDEKDYNSLYQCAISSRCFTTHALTSLYKLYNTSPVRSGGTEDEHFRSRRAATTLATLRNEQNTIIQKWALMWRSIVLSTFDQTYLPYYSYIRYLDLDDIRELLNHPGFAGKIKDDFFTPELLDFVTHDYASKGTKRLRSSRVIPENDWVLVKLGGAIVEKATSIRGMSCNVPSTKLSEWLEQLPQLQALTIWSGGSLKDHAGDKIRNHCPHLKQITIYGWYNEPPREAETDCETFLTELSPNTLEYFEMLSYSQLGPRSIRALGSHLSSLTELKLTSLTIDSIDELSSLTAPPALKVLMLTDSIPAPQDEKFYEVIARVAEWIRSCKALRSLELRKFVNDALLLSKVLTDGELHLSNLSVSAYTMAGNTAFHEALASQPSLQNLDLRGEASEIPQENEKLVQAICQLNDLRELELRDISDCFTPDHVAVLTPFLPRLEKLWISGDFFDDSIWNSFLCLPNLQSLAIHAVSDFSPQGILDFIAQLGPGNRGFSLSVLNATTESFIEEEVQAIIRESLKNNLGGSFDFGLAQEEYSETDSDADMSD